MGERESRLKQYHQLLWRGAVSLLIVGGIGLAVYGFVFAGWTIGTNTTANVSSVYDSLVDGLVGHWTFDGPSVTATTVADVSGNGNTGTRNGNVAPTIGKIGQGFQFDGNGDYVDTNGDNSLDFGTNSFTLSTWIKTTTTTNLRILSKRDIVNGAGYEMQMSDSSNGKIQAFVSNGTTAIYNLQLSNNRINDGIWHSVVYVFNRETNKVYSYVDGVLQTNSLDIAGLAGQSFNSATTLKLGRFGGTGTAYFNGSIDDVRVYNRVLSQAEITQLYNMGASKLGVTPTDSLDSGLVGHWDFDGKNVTATTVLDTSGNGNTGTRFGNASPTIGKIGQGFSFDGNDYISLSSALLPGTNDFTWSLWVKSAIPSPISKSLFVTSGWPGAGSINIYTHSTPPYPFAVYGDGGNVNVGTGGIAPNVNQYYFLTLARSGATMSFYIDGVYKGNDTSAGGNITGTYLRIANSWIGSIDDVRIYNRALSQSEITQLYNLGLGTTLRP